MRPPVYAYAGDAGGDRAAIEVQRFERGHIVEGFGPHAHDFHEIVLFDSAGGRHRVNRRSLGVARNDVDVLVSGTVHDAGELDGASGWMVLVRTDAPAYLTLPAWAVSVLSGVAASRMALEERWAARVRRGIADLDAFQSANESARDARHATTSLETILAELARSNACDARGESGLAYRHLERLVDYVDERLGEDITLAAIAEALALSANHLTAELRRRTGRSAMDWVYVRRLRAATERLSSSDEGIADIAARCGFSDAAHFARHFRSHYATSPARWRVSRDRGAKP